MACFEGKGTFKKTLEDTGLLILDIEYEGFNDPGNVFGPPESWCPPDRDVEFRIVKATLEIEDVNEQVHRIALNPGWVYDELTERTEDDIVEWCFNHRG